MRRITLQFPPEGEGQDMVLHADIVVGWRWTVTPPEGNPWTEETAIDAPYIDLEPAPGVPYGVKVELIDRTRGTALGFTHQETVGWPAQSVRMPVGFLTSVVP